MKHQTITTSANEIANSRGIKLTAKRRNILELLIATNKPSSAYDIKENYYQAYNETIPVMSVYRILDFFIEQGLAHKLESINQYIICDHVNCDHSHANAQFLICDDCNSTEEVVLEEKLHAQLADSVARKGFVLNELQFELHGTCSSCQTNKITN